MAEGDAWLLITDLLTFFVVRLFNIESYIYTVNIGSYTFLGSTRRAWTEGGPWFFWNKRSKGLIFRKK